VFLAENFTTSLTLSLGCTYPHVIHSSIGREAAVARSALTCDMWGPLAGRCPTAWGLPIILIGIEDTFEWEKQHIVVVVVVVLVLLL